MPAPPKDGGLQLREARARRRGDEHRVGVLEAAREDEARRRRRPSRRCRRFSRTSGAAPASSRPSVIAEPAMRTIVASWPTRSCRAAPRRAPAAAPRAPPSRPRAARRPAERERAAGRDEQQRDPGQDVRRRRERARSRPRRPRSRTGARAPTRAPRRRCSPARAGRRAGSATQAAWASQDEVVGREPHRGPSWQAGPSLPARRGRRCAAPRLSPAAARAPRRQPRRGR